MSMKGKHVPIGTLNRMDVWITVQDLGKEQPEERRYQWRLYISGILKPELGLRLSSNEVMEYMQSLQGLSQTLSLDLYYVDLFAAVNVWLHDHKKEEQQ